MADDDPNDDDKKPDPKPDDKSPKADKKDDDPKPEPKTVPLDEHAKLREKKNKQIEELEAELASFKNKPEPKDDKTKDEAGKDHEKRLKTIETRDRNRTLAAELGIDEDQAEAVATFLDKNSELEADEALVILKKRDPKKFKSEEPPAPAHGQLRPKAGSRPDAEQGPSWQDRLDYGKELAKTDKRASKQYANNLAGHFLAQAMGWEHKLIPIPQK